MDDDHRALGTSTRAYVVFSGSSNWGDLAFTSDEQIQQILSYGHTREHLAAFARTWKQRSRASRGRGGCTRSAGCCRVRRTGRELIPEEPIFGEGIYRYLPED